VTSTPLSVPAWGAVPEKPLALPPPEQFGGGGQFCGGGLIRVCVMPSMAVKTTSALSPTSTVPEIGSTQAKEEGLPEYLIWS